MRRAGGLQSATTCNDDRCARIADFSHDPSSFARMTADALAIDVWENPCMTEPAALPLAPDLPPDTVPPDPVWRATVLNDTRSWLEKAVIGLNLCPFAKAVVRKNQVRFVVSTATDHDTLADELSAELHLLSHADPESIDTTLLIHPLVLTDFYQFNAFLPQANRLLARLDLTGILQIASFHPAYEFAECAPDAIENYTNRSPYPMLHLLREASITRAVAAFPDADAIYENNILTLQSLGMTGWLALEVGAH